MIAPAEGDSQNRSRGAVLVTGAAGFIGSHLVDALLARGERVIGLDNFDDFYDPAIKRRNVTSALADPRFKLIEGDIRQLDLLERVLRSESISTVMHMAARAGVRPSIADPLLYQSVNVEGMNRVLEAMRRVGTRRLIFASSSSVYGNNRSVPFRETDNVDNPISPYAATKRAGELLCHTYHHLFGMSIACVRFFTVYGPRQRPEMAIHKFVRAALAGEPVTMYGDGSTSRDYTYIDDIIQGLLAIEARLDGYRIINLGESAPVTLARLLDLIGEATGARLSIERKEPQHGDVEVTYADISVARELGYRPRTTIVGGLRRFVEWRRAEDVACPNIEVINE